MDVNNFARQTAQIFLSLSLWFMDPCTAAATVLETGKALVILVPIIYKGCVIAWVEASALGAMVGGTTVATTTGGTAAAGSLLGPILIGVVVGAVLIGGAAYLWNRSKKVNVTYKDESHNTVKWAAAKLSETEKTKMLSQKGNISVTCFHVSCKSDHPKNAKTWDAIGFVLYSYNGKHKWTMNNVRCRSGYVVLISSDKLLKKQGSTGGTLHNIAFKRIFGKSPSELQHTLIGGGFSVQQGQCVFNSGSFNEGFAERDVIHFGTRVMNPLEQKYIAHTTKNWIDRKQQNTDVSTVPKDGDVLCVHPDFVKTEKGKQMKTD